MSLWIRVEADIADSAKVRRFGASIGATAEASVGLLVFLWGKVADKRESGDVSDVPDDLLEEWARWRGERGLFAKQFRAHFASDGQINDWRDHQGKLIERRAAERARWQRRHSAGASTGVTAEPPARTPVANGNGNGIKEEIPKSAERRVKRQVIDADEQSVLDHYREVHPKRLRGAIPDKTLKLLRDALKSYPAPDLCRAIDGNAGSEFHRDHGHMGLHLILRDSEKIDYFLDLAQKKRDEVQEITDDMGRSVPHRRNAAGDWEPIVSIA